MTTKAILLGSALALGALPAMAQDTIKIGAIFPLSGPNAQFGNSSVNGMRLALERMQEETDGIADRVELVVTDVPAPGDAPAATQRLINNDGVVGLIGSFSSSITLAASEITERAQVPMISHSFADQITERGYEYIFQISSKGSAIGAAQLNHAVEIAEAEGVDVSSIAILYEDTSYGTAQAAGIRDAAAEAGIEVAVDQGYPLGISDVSPLINSVRRAEPDIVFPVSYLNDSLLIVRTMRQQGLSTPVVGGAAGYIIPAFKDGLGEFTENVFSVAPANYDYVPEINADYEEAHGTFMPHEALMYGAALQHMITAIEEADSTDPVEIRDAISALEYCDGFASGLPGECIAFDETGATTTGFPIFVQWRGDDIVTVYPPESAREEPIWATAD
ncbi:branched chain amino acid ABC transporter substrate-binding protein [Allosediminivita pacifica]|uniref:Branched-chain amino acid transport system substrate-binding protein n=2 Tax=Allosediminivita pacifica TaxID=1267769 RepID=A0A2T6A4C8_9RHOB|nr:ABC transporter substrate-binding protein [Allosediminivita pacifica]PTX38669.1 branched-chain amino acid transport system substrate-binding protein [Allosediminivita pacifica]GGB28932.1 branched chain amino acid ABC transporter substrate-binding protein [Allosediminivita pacifica]